MNLDDLREFMRRGREAQRAVDEALGYALVRDREHTGIRCLACGLVSYHPEDVQQKAMRQLSCIPRGREQEALMTERFIVAEVSKNWDSGEEVTPTGLLAEQFERVINVNHARGYRLLSFALHRLMTSATEMNETIIAVFERRGESGDPDPEAKPTENANEDGPVA